jgi:F0F1-type ATP synthase delta subunit
MKNLANILQTQGMQAKHAGAVQANEARALENVGNLAQNNPDLAKLLNNPEVDLKPY